MGVRLGMLGTDNRIQMSVSGIPTSILLLLSVSVSPHVPKLLTHEGYSFSQLHQKTDASENGNGWKGDTASFSYSCFVDRNRTPTNVSLFATVQRWLCKMSLV
jgi:hypothetical protein